MLVKKLTAASFRDHGITHLLNDMRRQTAWAIAEDYSSRSKDFRDVEMSAYEKAT
jgi:hypothetical protein